MIYGMYVEQAGAAALLSLGSVGAGLANEFDLISSPTPTNNYLIDDAGVLNRTTKKGINDSLSRLEVGFCTWTLLHLVLLSTNFAMKRLCLKFWMCMPLQSAGRLWGPQYSSTYLILLCTVRHRRRRATGWRW